MTNYDFMKMATFSACHTPYDITEEIVEKMKDVHPNQILNSSINMFLYRVEYEYYTKRNNYKTSVKYVHIQSDHDEMWMETQSYLDLWASDFNGKNPHRMISNVKILDIRPIARTCLKIS